MNVGYPDIEIAGQTDLPIDLIDLENAHTELGNARITKTSTTDKNIFRFQEETRPEKDFAGIVGQSPTLLKALDLATIVAPTDSTVLLLGETGTGKELIASAIHDRSRRKNHRLVKVNCAAIPSGLLESELFGHERGAFTGAIAQKIGRFELADQGTLFLDEIGDIPLELQPKLLRVLQEREFESLGSVRTKKVDVRVVAATHRNLEELVLQKKFRSDLYYRLNVFPICIPPLRGRTEDIPLLVGYFVKMYADRMGKQIDAVPSKVMETLIRHPWPGNIRELQNFIERSVILTSGNTLRPPLADLQHEVAPTSHRSSEPLTLEQATFAHVLDALEKTNWVIGGPRGAAERLGLKRTTLTCMIQRMGLSRRENRPVTHQPAFQET